MDKLDFTDATAENIMRTLENILIVMGDLGARIESLESKKPTNWLGIDPDELEKRLNDGLTGTDE